MFGRGEWAATAALSAERLGRAAHVALFDPSAGVEGIAVSFRRPGRVPGTRVVLDFTFDGHHGRSGRIQVYANEIRSTGIVPLDGPWVCPPSPRGFDPVWRVVEFVVTSTRRAARALHERATP